MLKKFKSIFLILIILLTLTIVFGCAPKEKKEEEKIKVAFVISGVRSDQSWNQAHYEGMVYLQNQLPYVEAALSENVSQDAAEKVIRDYASQGYKIIFTCEYGFMDLTQKVAKDFPNTVFLNCSGYKTDANMGNYFGRMYQVDYLSGLIAGKMTKTNIIGVVVSFPIPQMIREINAFTIGVRQANPNAKVHVIWTNSWYDPGKEALATNTLISNGADVIRCLVGGMAPIEEAKKAGKYVIGYYYDKYSLAPDNVLTSCAFNWGVYYVDVVKQVREGKWKPETYWGHLSTGIVTLGKYGNMVTEDVKKLVEEKKQLIISGKYDPFMGPIYDQDGNLRVKEGEELPDGEKKSLNWFVEGVVGTIPK